jgi:thymidylate kinase
VTEPCTRLIFVEGMPGAGKSTTAIRIADWLRARGEAAHAYHELADDNPIRSSTGRSRYGESSTPSVRAAKRS